MYDTYVDVVPNTLPARLYNAQEGDIMAYLITTCEKECITITEAVYGTKDGATFVVTISFMNATRSVPDPSVLNVPSICDNAPAVPKMLTLGDSMLFH